MHEEEDDDDATAAAAASSSNPDKSNVQFILDKKKKAEFFNKSATTFKLQLNRLMQNNISTHFANSLCLIIPPSTQDFFFATTPEYRLNILIRLLRSYLFFNQLSINQAEVTLFVSECLNNNAMLINVFNLEKKNAAAVTIDVILDKIKVIINLFYYSFIEEKDEKYISLDDIYKWISSIPKNHQTLIREINLSLISLMNSHNAVYREKYINAIVKLGAQNDKRPLKEILVDKELNYSEIYLFFKQLVGVNEHYNQLVILNNQFNLFVSSYLNEKKQSKVLSDAVLLELNEPATILLSIQSASQSLKQIDNNQPSITEKETKRAIDLTFFQPSPVAVTRKNIADETHIAHEHIQVIEHTGVYNTEQEELLKKNRLV